jgi:hypothetical protein
VRGLFSSRGVASHEALYYASANARPATSRKPSIDTFVMRWWMRRPLLIAIAAAIVSSAAKAWLAYRYFGFQTGDDVEIAEEAFRRAVGMFFYPWDVRNLFIPDLLVAPFVAAAHSAGVDDRMVLAHIARYPFIILSGVNVLLVFALGRRWYGDTVAVVASTLYAFHWIPLVYGSSLYPRTVAVTCVLAAAILLSRGNTARRALLAGLVTGLAVTARYSEAVYFISLLLFILYAGDRSNRWRQVTAFTAGFVAAVTAAIGLYDRLTYGRWFGSLVQFAELTFVTRDAASLAVFQPPWWYLTNLPHWMPLTLLPGFIIAIRMTELRRAAMFVGAPVVALSAIFHKELRYLQVVVPFALLIAVYGLSIVWQRRPDRRSLIAILVLLAVPLGMTRIGQVARRSTNAVAAAVWIGSRQPASVSLSQSWAYGGRIFLDDDVVTSEAGIPPDLSRIRKEVATLSVLAVYASDADRALRTLCAEHGLYEAAVFRGLGGRSVVVFARRATAASRP